MKTSLLSALSLLAFSAPLFAENHDEKYTDELVHKIQEKHIWLYAYAIEKTADIHLSESMWKLVLGESKNPTGYSTFKRMGKAFVDLSDRFGDTSLEKKCGFGVKTTDERDNRQSCKQAIDVWGDRYSVTVNAAKVEASNDAFKMVLGYVSSVAIFLEDGSASLWHHGYEPKTEKLHVIINADHAYKGVKVSWDKDGTTVTINAPADLETAGWHGKIEKGLKAGWKEVTSKKSDALTDASASVR